MAWSVRWWGVQLAAAESALCGVALLALEPALVDTASLAGAGVAAAGAALESVGAGLGAPDPLKSVAYQPAPLSWNPAAVTCFLNAGCAHEGQSTKGASESFCSTSLAKPQESHL